MTEIVFFCLTIPLRNF